MLDANRCRLRPVERKDLAVLLSWRNFDHIRAVMYTDHIITDDDHKAWFERFQGGKESLALVFETAGIPAGVVNLNRIDRGNGICHWGFYIGIMDAPKGCGSVMGFLALEYIFEKLEIRKLIGEVFAFNRASVNFHRKLGFSEEGIFRRHVFKNGIYEDIITFAFFGEDWKARKPSIERLCLKGGLK